MKNLLAYFYFNNVKYQIYLNDNNSFDITISGNSIGKNESKRIIDEVIKCINKKIKRYVGKIMYQGELLDLYSNDIADMYYFGKNGNVFDINNEKYYPLFQSYNFYVSINISGKKEEQISDESMRLTNYSYEMNYFNQNRKRKIALNIANGVIYLTVFLNTVNLASMFLLPRIYADSVPVNSISEVTETVKPDEDKLVYEKNQVYMTNRLMGISDRIDYSKLSFKTIRFLDAIISNPNLTDELKKKLVEGFANYFESNLKFIDFDSYEKICLRVEDLKIDEDYTENGVSKLSDGTYVSGYYVSGENKITLFSRQISVLSHEFNHVIGRLRMVNGELDLINEGCNEYYNPYGNITYKDERLFYLMLEQIYGRETFKRAFFNNGFEIEMNNSSCEYTDEDRKVIAAINKYANSDFLNSNSDTDVDQEVLNKQKYEALSMLRELYEKRTGLSFDDNIVMKTCYSFITGENVEEYVGGHKVLSVRVSDNGEKIYLEVEAITAIKQEDGTIKKVFNTCYIPVKGEEKVLEKGK